MTGRQRTETRPREFKVLTARRASLKMRRHFGDSFGVEFEVEIITQPLCGDAAFVKLALEFRGRAH